MREADEMSLYKRPFDLVRGVDQLAMSRSTLADHVAPVIATGVVVGTITSSGARLIRR